ncbi:cytochrome P450 [Trametes coccinea BRFM310]|uniref:Cytochrome P450 n=1 Tax=Trametes coccinea (strain BRFM310) TaxID=1353009 RepID=A0A1Y2J0P5_TRAC3|nr:cytochrome P450 [Trametes coccinea BRFM310]
MLAPILFLLVGAILVAFEHFRRRRRLSSLPPGPRGWPIIGNILDMPTSYHWITFADWSKQWGDIMSVSLLGQTVVIINSPKHAIDILEKKSSIYCSRAAVPVAGDMIGWSRAMLLAPYGPRLREMRKMFANVLATRHHVARFHGLIEDETRHFLVGLSRRSDSLVDDLHKLAAAIIMTVAYGYKVRGNDDPIVKTVDEVMEDLAHVAAPGAFLADVFPFLSHIPSWAPGAQWKRKVAEQRQAFNRMADVPFDWVKREIKAGTALPSFTSALLEGKSDPAREELIKMTAASLYSGGADTTVSAINSFFLAMSCFPEAQRKAQAEIDAVIGHDRLPTLQDRDSMPYMNALVLEVLRWMPVTPVAFFHELIQDDVHEGYFLPKGTRVVANVWKFLHDPQTYSDPMRFNPDRFIPTKDMEAERDPRDFCFGFGRRRCPGMAFAEASIFAACSMALALYNISKATRNGQVVEPLMEGTGGLISHPVPFECSISVRSEEAQALLDSIADGAPEAA